MNENLSKEEFVNSYFDNELSEMEQLNFKSKLLNDSELREEYKFQKDLIDGIKEVRRVELKTRLNKISINTPLYQTIGFKTLVAILISAGIGVTTYYSLNSENFTSNSLIDIQRKDLSNGSEMPIPKTPISINKNSDTNINNGKGIKESFVESSHSKIQLNNKKIETTIIKPSIVQPNIVESFEDESLVLKSENTDNDITIISDKNTETTIEVTKIKDKRKKFHYKFSDNKLYLIGNFNDIPYEIIELNSTKGKTYFLHYNDGFYRIISEQLKPTPLVEIENDSLINELKIIQSKQEN